MPAAELASSPAMQLVAYRHGRCSSSFPEAARIFAKYQMHEAVIARDQLVIRYDLYRLHNVYEPAKARFEQANVGTAGGKGHRDVVMNATVVEATA